MKYRVVYFKGDARRTNSNVDLTMQQILAASLIAPSLLGPEPPQLTLVLVPETATAADLAGVRGDDWDDAPADCNAAGPYEHTLPPGSRTLTFRLGELVDGRDFGELGGDSEPLDAQAVALTPGRATRGKLRLKK